MSTDAFALIVERLKDPANGWSIGSFGAIGEFVRDPDEEVAICEKTDQIEVVTARGAIRATNAAALTPIAWDSLSGDGESWGHSLAFCIARPVTANRFIRVLGLDAAAIREQDRASVLIDCGVGAGAVTMAMRTSDAGLIAAATAAEGQSMLGAAGLMGEVLRAQPHRVLISPAGRIEVFQPIPPPDGKSPEGPHTHLLTKLIVKDRCHSANVPIPDGWQSALSLHPKSPWRTMLGERHPFEADTDAAFAPLLARYELEEDADVASSLRGDLDAGVALRWPDSRRGRNKARIVLRRLAAAGDHRVKQWRVQYDRAPIELEEGEEE